MYGRWVRCSESSAVELRAEQTSARNGSHLLKKSLLLWGCAAASLALTAQAIAQSTQTLPQVTVEGKGSTAKKGTAKGAPKAAPQQPAEPVQHASEESRADGDFGETARPPNRVALLDQIGRDVHALAVDLHVAVADDLAGGKRRRQDFVVRHRGCRIAK
jgi:hypothetical protein